MNRRRTPDGRGAGPRRQLFAEVTETEYQTVRRLAEQDGLTVADFIRRCVNGYLLEIGDDVPLIAEHAQAHG